MALFDRPGFARLVEAVEQRVGLTVMPTEQRAKWQTMEQEFIALGDEAEDLALHSMDYFTGRPSEMAHERRKRIAQRSRVALKFDPLAGAEAQLLADFAFGKGVPKPTARDEKVQQIIDEAWSDPNNDEKLTGYLAQRKLSNELLTAGELFVTLYVRGGKIRVGRLDPDTVDSVVPDPEDRLRPLWYVARKRRFEWDYNLDAPKIADELYVGGRPAVKYWKHWRNYDDAIAEREQGVVDAGEQSLITPPAQKIAKGLVFHLAINQTGEELRGNPPWARSLRFYNAMNVLLEAHVNMAQAASTIIAKRVIAGSPRQVTKAATAVLGHLSELGAARMGDGESRAFAPDGQQPPAPGSWWAENGSDRLEAVRLDSGSGQMAQTAQIVRAPIAAASGFGQHYLGDASDANLATASTLELPATMHVESWQQFFEMLYRWFTDRAIEAAVKAGRLGGLDGFPEDGPLGSLRLAEAESRTAMEKRTKTDLSYEFVMPFPGRRQIPEVVAFVQGLCVSMDPNGVNVALRRQLLRFAYEQIGMADVGRAVEEAIPDEGIPGGIGPGEPPLTPEETAKLGGFPNPASGAVPPNPRPGGAPPKPAEGTPKNVKRGTTIGGKPTADSLIEAEWVPPELRKAVAELEDDVARRFRLLVAEPAMAATLALAAGSNGASGGDGAADAG
jgi:hypothetical protein